MSITDATPKSQSPQRFIPRILRETPRWCCWKLSQNRAGDLTKRPDCSTKDEDAQRAFDAVKQKCTSKQGIGFITGGRVKTPRGYLVAFDYDNCHDPNTGGVSPWAIDAVEAFGNSFTEISPSGYGLRQWVLVKRLPERRIRSVIPVTGGGIEGCTKKVECQLFGIGAHGGGYVTVTGNHLVGTATEVMRIESIEKVFEHFDFPIDYAAAGEELVDLPEGTGDEPSLDVIDVALRSQPNGVTLIDGDWEEAKNGRNELFESASEAYFELEQRALVAANGHGEQALQFLLDRTAWGHGDIENSKDPGKYEREDWVREELLRTCGKTYVLNPGEVFDEIDEDEMQAQVEASIKAANDALNSERAKQAAKSPIAQIEAPIAMGVEPPRRVYLIKHPDGTGLLPLGKAGLISAAGGTGKTTALVQLAISVATGRRWFDHFRVGGDDCGKRVLFLMGEEDVDEVQRKLWHTMHAMGLSLAERAEVAARVECVPLAGHALPFLSQNKNGAMLSTPHSDALMQRLDAGEDWGLVIVDPISRFCGVNVEGDNILATRFVQELERYAAAPGNPTVLGVGHTSKAARAQGSAEQRGVTGLIDAVRFGASMLSRDDGRVLFEVQKNNYAPPSPEPVLLMRGKEGHLSVESDSDRAAREALDENRRRETDEAKIDRLIAEFEKVVEKKPGVKQADLKAMVAGRNVDMNKALIVAVDSGRLIVEIGPKNAKLFRLPERSGLLG